MTITIDKCGYFYEEDKFFFHTGDVKLLSVKDTTLNIAFQAGGISLDFATNEKALEIFQMIRNYKISSCEDEIKSYQESKNRSVASLTLQAKMNEKVGALY